MATTLDLMLKDSPIVHVLTRREDGVSLYIKREDLLHPQVSGNKFRKLKYNLAEAQKQGHTRLLTFGGAFSNHIAAVAAAGKILDLQTIGVIRGDELGRDMESTLKKNPTLDFAASQGMKFLFVSRSDYREKETTAFRQDLEKEFGSFYLIPEGGTNTLAVKGCEEILTGVGKDFDFICCAVGTGGTIAGLINAAAKDQKVLGFPALKGDFLEGEISKYTSATNWELVNKYHFGGYAKVSPELIDFINDFRKTYDILLDPVYTGKMLFGIFDMMENAVFPQNSRILAIHTGGLQGITGMNKLLKNKNFPLIDVENEI
ncbi:1-aminocyclopropane-1-carboxylate deaminase/D-cysteine desulfhydrase [Antarcticibacterium flavum]|uniref:1-aminocyclopropane-1-carboxylate deaminase/D-cysteine desulfhydrase n=1 Tax=Antarcticibacterium flavum TaxID=2058175 RepID=A0A5B7X6S7_9FLAO|nr:MULTISPECIES: pyridoxal-phosphate dependent enzyme [Antarcticibacterium]MCM4159563.1 1-aminocyclopropane-1-carboxylate deaminase [Antarcticibacterium sp. W02-3]QCY70815.1 1-aminocyclopropane-1-carboxylate deaminase/D-cysteine desulfhydrase [Antarcticibacterium flavum]